jgi:hypothetical protein
MKPIYIISGGYRRHIGNWYKERNLFFKQVDSRRHKLRVLDAYGIDSKTLEKTLVKNDAKIILEEIDTKNWYSTTAKIFKEKGQYYHFINDADHNIQLFLPLSNWTKWSQEEKEKYLALRPL